MMRPDSLKHTVAVIIGRAGSKGLPGKNSMCVPLVPDPQPVVTYSIQAAKDSSLVSRIIVSTDSDAIREAAMDQGVEVVWRPAHLASDTATVDAAVRHAIDEAQDDAPTVVILYANVPVRPQGLIDRAVDELHRTGADSVQSYCEVGKYHPYWMVTLDQHQRVVPHVQNAVYRRQDLPQMLIPDGGVIAVTRQSLFTVVDGKPHAFLGDDRRGIINAHGSVVDIDSYVDALVAGAMLLKAQGHHEVPVATR